MSAVIRVLREIFISWLIRIFTANDIVRHEVLKLVIAEIYRREVPGCVAELGVYKGDFAKRINIHFPDRKLFLFDTFDGFDERDVSIETGKGYMSKSMTQKGDFTNASIELVLKKMKYRSNCVVKKGWFPETAEDIDERFAFVSIDADLFEPIYRGLLFFYPRLEKGGYIFVHDYNGKMYGARDAVQRFSREFNVPYVPLNDVCGSAIFTK